MPYRYPNQEIIVGGARLKYTVENNRIKWTKWLWPTAHNNDWILLTHDIIINWIEYADTEKDYIDNILKKYFKENIDFLEVTSDHKLVVEYTQFLVDPYIFNENVDQNHQWFIINGKTLKYSMLVANFLKSEKMWDYYLKTENIAFDLNNHLFNIACSEIVSNDNKIREMTRELNMCKVTHGNITTRTKNSPPHLEKQYLACIKITLNNEKYPFIYKIFRTKVRNMKEYIHSACSTLLQRGVGVVYTRNHKNARIYAVDIVFAVRNSLCSMALGNGLAKVRVGKYKDWYVNVAKFTMGKSHKPLCDYFLPTDMDLYVNDRGALELSNDAYNFSKAFVEWDTIRASSPVEKRPLSCQEMETSIILCESLETIDLIDKDLDTFYPTEKWTKSCNIL